MAGGEEAMRSCRELIKRPEFRRDRELSGQMNDASISVMFNISEGFLRRRDKETMQFLPAETADLIELNESIAKMLRRWQSTLEVQGPRTKDQGRTKDQEPRPKDQA